MVQKVSTFCIKLTTKMQTKDLVSTLKRFDAYPKTLEDFRIKTFGGGAGK